MAIGTGMINYSAVRENMIESQVRPNGITDRAIIDAMSSVPRELFVPESMRSLAYMDEDVPMTKGVDGRQRYLMEPMAFARLLQSAAIKPDDAVLDVGCGSGYSSAVLSKMAQLVVAIESDATMAAAADDNLLRLQASNVAVFNSALKEGHKSEAPFNVIIINGRVEEVPETLFEQLAEKGRLVAIMGTTDNAKAMVYIKTDGVVAGQFAFDASVSPLPGFEKASPGFVFCTDSIHIMRLASFVFNLSSVTFRPIYV